MEKTYEVVADVRKLSYEEWKNARLSGIGGSEAAIACGLSRWSSPFKLYNMKKGLIKEEKKDDASEERMHFGKLLEPVIRKEFSVRIGHEIKELPYMLRSKKYPWMQCNIDGYFEDELGVNLVEIKTTSSYGESDWNGDNDCPAEYLIQCAHYMLIMGPKVKRCYLVCLIGGNHLVWKIIDRDEELMLDVAKLEKQFWDCVQNNTQLKISNKDSDFLGTLYPISTLAKTIELPQAASDWLKDYKDAVAIMSKAKNAKELAEARFKEAMKDADAAVIDGFKITWKSSTATRLDTVKIKALLTAQQLKDCSTKIESRRFAVKEIKTK